MEKAILKFAKVNGVQPGRIILYRDGVGEGQAQAVCLNEVTQIK